jgi:ribosomal subunit interface protein
VYARGASALVRACNNNRVRCALTFYKGSLGLDIQTGQGRTIKRSEHMSFRISGKNIDVGDALRGRISERIDGAVGKYFDRGYSGHAVIGKDGAGFVTECALHLDSGTVLKSEAAAEDAYHSADLAAEKIEKQLRRGKRRRKDHQAVRVGR